MPVIDIPKNQQAVVVAMLEKLVAKIKTGSIEISRVQIINGYWDIPDNSSGFPDKIPNGTAIYTLHAIQKESPDHHADDPGRVDVIADYNLVISYCDSDQPEQDNCPGRI